VFADVAFIRVATLSMKRRQRKASADSRWCLKRETDAARV